MSPDPPLDKRGRLKVKRETRKAKSGCGEGVVVYVIPICTSLACRSTARGKRRSDARTGLPNLFAIDVFAYS